MVLADASVPIVAPSSVVATLDGVTTVLTAFIFVCLVLPSMVKHRPQFYAALACIAGIILMHTLILVFGVIQLGSVAIGILQFVALLLLVLCVGGLTVRELAGDMAKAYEVIRRGETVKETIIPIGDQAARRGKGEPSSKVYKIDSDEDAEEDQDKGIPLS
jgi:hypothetical protein